jgi:hypothetical protein
MEAAVERESSRMLYSVDGKRRVLIAQRPDGKFGLVEQYWYDNSYEGDAIRRWANLSQPASIFETEAIAEREAKTCFPWAVIRTMTANEHIAVGRASFELQNQFGWEAHKFAAERAEAAFASGDLEQAQFWKWVEQSLTPRGPTPPEGSPDR